SDEGAAVTTEFVIDRPRFDAAGGTASFTYRLANLTFTESLGFPRGWDRAAAASASFARLLDLTALVLGVSYFKLRAPLQLSAPELALDEQEHRFIIDVY